MEKKFYSIGTRVYYDSLYDRPITHFRSIHDSVALATTERRAQIIVKALNEWKDRYCIPKFMIDDYFDGEEIADGSYRTRYKK